VVLPDALVTGAAPHSVAACSAVSTRSRIGPTSASSWAVDHADARELFEQPGAGMCGDTVGDSGLNVGESSLHGTERGNLGGDDGAQGVIGQADWGDGGVAQATEQLGGRLAAAVGVPSAERCHTCLAQPAGRLRVG